MTLMQILASQPWVERLGLTLLHFVWQGAFIAAVYAVARKTASRPTVRYNLACAALALMALAPLATWTALQPPAPSAATLPSSASRAAAARPNATSTPWLDPSLPLPPPLLSWIDPAWFLGAAFFALRLGGASALATRLRRRGVPPAPPAWQ